MIRPKSVKCASLPHYLNTLAHLADGWTQDVGALLYVSGYLANLPHGHVIGKSNLARIV